MAFPFSIREKNTGYYERTESSIGRALEIDLEVMGSSPIPILLVFASPKYGEGDE